MFLDFEFIKTCLNGLRSRIEKVENGLRNRIEKVEDWIISFRTNRPNWAQNDPEALDYVKNRTHWDDESQTRTIDYDAWKGDRPSIPLILGVWYEVSWSSGPTSYSYAQYMNTDEADGRFECKQNSAGELYVGFETEAPFCIYSDRTVVNNSWVLVYYVRGLKLTGEITPGLHQLDKKYIPRDVWHKICTLGNSVEQQNLALSSKMDANNPTGTGVFSLNRKTGTSLGAQSFAAGNNNTASGDQSFAAGNNTSASGAQSFAVGNNTSAYGECSFVSGYYNVNDYSNKYSHIVGNGNGPGLDSRHNAYTLDWSGNGWFAGDVFVGGSGQESGVKLLKTGEAIPIPQTASVGQSIVVKTVDGNGKPTEWEATDKMDKANPTGTGSFSLNRKSDTEIGNYSFTEGSDTTASGYASHAEGIGTTASGDDSHAEGYNTIASGEASHAEGGRTKAASQYQHAQGKYNIEDSSDTYADIIGNGTSGTERSNAATVDWSGNAWYAGDVYVGSTSGTNKDDGSKKLATEEYVDSASEKKADLSVVPNKATVDDFVLKMQREVVGDEETSIEELFSVRLPYTPYPDISSVPALGDNTTDDSVAIQALLDKYDYVYLPAGTYYIQKNPLKMTRDYCIFICEGTLIVNTTSAIELQASYCHLKIANIDSRWGGTWNEETKWTFKTNAIKVGSSSVSVLYNTIEIDSIKRSINGLWLQPSGEGLGVAHNTFKFGYIQAERCIYFNPGDAAYVYINGNYFWCGRCIGNYAVYTEKSASQTDPFNGNVFYHLAFEGCQKPMTLQFFYMNQFKDLRLAQQENTAIPYPDPLIVFDEYSYGNTIESHANLNVDRIVDPVKDSYGWAKQLGNLYIPKYVVTGPNETEILLGYTAQSSYGYFIVDNDYHITTEVYNASLDLSDNKYAINGRVFKCTATSTNVVITLPMGYRQRGATEFYVYVDSIDSASYGITVMQEGVEIVPAAALTEIGLYKAELFTSIGWVVTKISALSLLPEGSLPEMTVDGN